MKKKELIPACMPKTFEEIRETALSVRGLVETIQLDIMDGKYVPEKTWPFMHKNDFILEEMKSGEKGFPLWEELNYELDLMVERPEKTLDTWLSLGASRVIFHYASVSDWDKIRRIDPVIRNFTPIGLALTIYDDLEEIFRLIDEKIVDFIQVMGIARIGYMGEPFTEKSLEVIRQIKEKYPELVISVDGGVSEHTIPELRELGVERFVSGSAVFGGGSIEENIHFLKEEIEIKDNK